MKVCAVSVLRRDFRGRCSDQTIYGVIIIEPLSVYENRKHRAAGGQNGTDSKSEPISANRPVTVAALNAPLEFGDGWDETIMAYVRSRRGERLRIISLVSILRKCVRHRNSRHKNEIKGHILRRITALIRSRKLIRVNRCFVVAADINCR